MKGLPASAAEGRRTLSAQGERHGTLADGHPTTRRVCDIFERLVRSAGRRPGTAFEAHVIDAPKIVVEFLRGGLELDADRLAP